MTEGPLHCDAVYYKYRDQKAKQVDPVEFDRIADAICEKFFNIDGLTLRDYLPRPHEPLRYPDVYAKYDKLSVQDRLDQLDFSDEDKATFATLAGGFGQSHPRDVGFMEAANWFARVGGSNAGINEYCSTYKIGNGGTTSLARAILSDFEGDLVVNAPVAEIAQDRQCVKVTLRDSRQVKARYLICTIPLNVLPNIKFSPPLSQLKTQASSPGVITKGTKYHFQFSQPQPHYFAGATFDSPFGFTWSDHHGKQGKNTYAIGFGNGGQLKDIKDSKQIIASYQSLFPKPGDISGYAIHDWRDDEFAQSGWACFGPECASKYLRALQEPHGDRVFMASGDWADGWRGFIDGAIEQGTRNARRVTRLLRTPTAAHMLRARL